jgi:hypothetical protein
MEANSQSSTDARQPEAIVVDRRFGKRSDTVRKNISRGLKRYMRGAPREVSALHTKLRDRLLGKPRTDLRGRTGPTPGKSRATASWEFVKLRANGASLPATAKECGMKLSGADYRIQALGLPRYRSLYDIDPFVGRHARHLWRLSGLTHSEFAGQLGISSRNVQADVTPKHRHMHIDPERAGKYLAWRDRVVQQLLAEAPGEKGKRVRWGKSSVLRTFFPNLREVRGLLVETLPSMAGYFRDHAQADANELGELVCDQAQAEKKRDPHTLRWRKLLPWLPRLMPTLMRNSDLLRRTSDQTGAAPRLWKLALSVLADYFGVSSATLQRAMEQKTHQIAPDMLRRLIEDMTRPTDRPAAQREKKRPGPHGPTKAEADKKYFQVALKVCQAIPRFEHLIIMRSKPRGKLLSLGYSDHEIDAIRMPGSFTATTAARWFISLRDDIPFDTVAHYHRQARQPVQKSPS